MPKSLPLCIVPGQFAIATLPAAATLPSWFDGTGFSAMVRAEDELTLVCDQSRVPSDVKSDRDWACLRTVGPFEFDAAGIVHALITPLSEDDIGVFVLCTFDGEHILVKSADLPRAKTLLTQAGHSFTD